MKKIGLLCLALVLALGALGVGYSAWTDVITINGSVSTGSACLCIAESGLLAPASSDKCIAGNLDVNGLGSSCGPPIVLGTGQPSEPKDVACTTVTWVDCNTLSIVVTNGYPYYAASVDFNVCNCGTVPLRIWRVEIADDYGHVSTFYGVNPSTVCLNLDNVDGYDMILAWGDSWGNQLEKDECADLSLGFVLLQPLPQNQTDTLHFTITLTAIQWDEYVKGPLPTP
jgi:hypothetical protein